MKSKSNKHITIDISPTSVFWVVIILLGINFLANIWSVLVLVFISILIATAFGPLINFLETKKIPRSLSSLIIILLFFVAFGFLIASVISPLVEQTQGFIDRLPELVEKISPYKIGLDSIPTQAFSVPNQVLKLAVGTLTGFIATFTMLVISYYMLQERPRLKKHLKTWLGTKSSHYYHIITKLENRLGKWVIGIILLMIIVGVLSYTGFALIGLPYAVALGVIAGILEIIPNIGPVVAAIPAIIVGFSVSPTHGFAALVVAVLVQQLENNLLVPKIMQKAVGLNPIITIIALLIGYKLGGPALAIISLPITLSIQEIISHLHLNRKNHLPEID